MLGYVVVGDEARDQFDRLLASVALRLAGDGLRLAGAVQQNSGPEGDCRCEMCLRLLHDGCVVRISQPLGPGASGCRLDAGALEEVAQAVAVALASGPDLLIVNKFGKQEASGRGLRPVIAAAVEARVPVLLAVSGEVLRDFLAFAEGLAESVELEAVEAWARCAVAHAGPEA